MPMAQWAESPQSVLGIVQSKAGYLALLSSLYSLNVKDIPKKTPHI